MKSQIISSALSLALATPLFAVNACPLPVDVTQSDGTSVRLQAQGDEFTNWFEDNQGFSVVRNGNTYVYATLGTDGSLAPTALKVGGADPVKAKLPKKLKPTPAAVQNAKARLQPAAQATTGTQSGSSSSPAPAGSSSTTPSGVVKNLVVLCRFSDHDDTKIRLQSDFDTLLNKIGGDPSVAPTGSVRDYYAEASYGAVDLQSTVVAWVTLPHTEAYYANGQNGLSTTYPQNGQGMVKDALDLVDTLVDFGQFDANNDGYIDAIDIIHSGYGAETGGGGGNWIWSHKWALYQVPGGFYTTQDNNSVGVKVKVYDYHTEPALSGNSGSTITRIGVICHETGHFFGLPDLYDTDNTSQGIGSYCLMSNSWGFSGNGMYPPHFSAWCKLRLGWVTPTQISGGSITAPQVKDNKSIFRVDTGFPSGEYLLIENREPVGFESDMPQGGLAIWHIDEAKGNNNTEGYPGQTGWPTNGNHYEISLLQADGLYEMEKNLNRGNGGDVYQAAGVSAITPTTTPNTSRYQGGTVSPSNTSITSISAAGSLMTFNIGNSVYPAITSPLVASCQVNQPFSYQIVASNGPTSYSSSGLPSGLSLNTSTGLISGVPGIPGTFTATLTATNSAGSANSSLMVTVAGGFAGTGYGPIADGGSATPPDYGAPLVINIPVSGVTQNLSGAAVDLGMIHPFAGDLDVVLSSPGGAHSLVLFSRIGVTTVGGTGDGSHFNGTYSFSDTATGTDIWTLATTDTDGDIPPGAYRTSAPGDDGQTNPPPLTSFASAFGGLTPAEVNGTWTITIRDATIGNTGSVSSAVLRLMNPSPAKIVVENPVGTGLVDGTASINFGSVTLGSTTVTSTFTVKNTGSQDLTGLALTKSGSNNADFTLGTLATTTLAPGASTTFTVTFKPSASGTRTAALQIASNDATQNPFDVNLTGSGLSAPEIAVENPVGKDLVDGSSTVSYGDVNVGVSVVTTFTVRNVGSASLTSLALSKNGTNSNDFTLGRLSSTTLAAGASTTFTVTFKPAAAGTRTAAIHLASNDANENPFDINLTGNGVSKPVIVVQYPKGTSLTSGVSVVNFGKVNVGSSGSAFTFYLLNKGNASLTGIVITKAGANPGDFTVSSLRSSTLSAGGSTTFTVTFKPLAAGTRAADILIASNDPANNPFDVLVTGNVTAVAAPPLASSLSLTPDLATSLSPVASDTTVTSLENLDGLNYQSLTVIKAPGTQFQTRLVEVSPNLLDWFSGVKHTTIMEDDESLLRVRDNTPYVPGVKRFIRLKP